jgi:CopG family transcriptional regulator/antitoxin EndoAI
MNGSGKEVGALEENRRVIVRMPHHLVDALDKMADGEGRHRSEVIRESVEFYIAEQRKRQLRQELIQGYQELGTLNAVLAEEPWEYAGVPQE